MKPDWSKAPEGATHWAPATNWLCASFMKYQEGKWYCESASGRCWVEDVAGDDPERYIPRPAVLTGEGLPPVGTVCELLDRNTNRWLPVEIVFLSSWVVVVRDTNAHPDGAVDLAFDLTDVHPQFRPARTPEQIAAEEREKAIKQLAHELPALPNMHVGEEMALRWAACLHDAGYRKVEGGAE